MYGYVYLSINLLTDQKYIGKHIGDYDPRFVGKGRVLRRAILKYGLDSFTLEILAECSNKTELNKKYDDLVVSFRAREPDSSYTLASGGGGPKPRNDRSAIARRIWDNMPEDRKRERADKIRKAHTGRSRSEDHKKAISKSKIGKPRMITPQDRLELSRRRKVECAQGINRPPKGNAGNRAFRHSEASKDAIRKGVYAAMDKRDFDNENPL